MSFSRREFLKTSGAAGIGCFGLTSLGALLPASRVFAQAMPNAAKPDRFFVLMRIQGGLDVTLGLDPWLAPQRPNPSDMFIEYRHDELIQAGGQAGSLWLGPAASPLAPFNKDLLVLNGVLVSEVDNGHPAAIGYMSTGNGQGKAPDLPVEMAALKGLGPYGILTSFSLSLAGRKTAFVRGSDIIRAQAQPDNSDALEKAVHASPRSPLERAIRDVVLSKDVTKKLRDEMEERMKASNSLRDEHVAASCFLSGACAQAMLEIQVEGSLDTHSNHEGNHMRMQKEAFERVAGIFDLFKSIPWGAGGESLFDRTTFMVVSEFARTPALNGAKGKDHNPLTNSVLFAGAGIQGGKSVNKSLLIEAKRSKTGASYHMASPFDYKSGQPANSREGADFIYPENVVKTALAVMGADLTKVRSVPQTAKVIPGIMK